jgi:ferredoxin
MMLDEELFGCDELGYAVVRGDGSLSHEQEEVAARAAMNCPERAITVDDEA